MALFYWSIKDHGFQMLINKKNGLIFVDQHPGCHYLRFVLLINKKKKVFLLINKKCQFHMLINKSGFWVVPSFVIFLYVWSLQFLDCPLKFYCPTACSGLHLCLYTAVRLVIVHQSLLLFEAFVLDWCHLFLFHDVSHVVHIIHIVYVLR